MRRLAAAAFTVLLACHFLSFGAQLADAQRSAAQPGDDWPRWASPEEAGFSSAALEAIDDYWHTLDSWAVSSLFVVYNGKVLMEIGDLTYPYWCHSMRKSFLSALYGLPIERGQISRSSTMAELGIDDEPPITEEEARAQVHHLLEARSGVYHEAACEAQGMKDARPERGSHPPGTFWYYNNWDFNVLGTIFRQETGKDIFREFQRRFARPLGMQDFSAAACEYAYQRTYSIHPCYTFRMSVRDRARFGELFLHDGRWGDRQLVSPEWVEESTRAHSDIGTGQGYGYMWWTLEPGFFRQAGMPRSLRYLSAFYASGYGGQFIFIVPDASMVIVTGVDVPLGGFLDGGEIGPILISMLVARDAVDLDLLRAKAKQRTVAAGEKLRLVATVKNRSACDSVAATVDFYLSPASPARGGAAADSRWIGAADLAAMAGKKRKTVRLSVSVPPDLPAGTYLLAASVDEEKANYDLRRDNNLLVAKQPIEVR